MHLALLHGGGARGGVGDEARDDPVEVRQARLPVAVVPVQPDELALLPLDELEGSGADRLVGAGRALEVHALEQMLREHRRLVPGEGPEDVGRRLVELEDRRLGIRRLDIGDGAEGVGAARVDLLQDLEDRELHVGARERLAVVEADAAAEPERNGPAVVAHLPRLRQAGLGVQVEVVLEEPIVDLGGDLADRARGGKVRGERRRLGLDQHHQGAAAFLGVGNPARREEDRGRQQGEQGGPETA